MILDHLSNKQILLLIFIGSFILAGLVLYFIPELIGTQQITHNNLSHITEDNFSNLFK